MQAAGEDIAAGRDIVAEDVPVITEENAQPG